MVLVRQHRAQVPIPDGTGYHTVRKTLEYQFHPENSKRGEDRRGDLDRADSAEHGWVGVLRVKEGQDKLATDGEGWLKPGEEVGVERDAVAALKAHRHFGTKFWMVGHAPGTIYPRPVDWRSDVRRATAKLNEEVLVEMIAAERRSHGRADLIAEAEDALSLVREELAEAAAAAAAKPAPKQKATA
jgi:hypothetical protein